MMTCNTRRPHVVRRRVTSIGRIEGVAAGPNWAEPLARVAGAIQPAAGVPSTMEVAGHAAGEVGPGVKQAGPNAVKYEWDHSLPTKEAEEPEEGQDVAV